MLLVTIASLRPDFKNATRCLIFARKWNTSASISCHQLRSERLEQLRLAEERARGGGRMGGAQLKKAERAP